MSLLFSKGLVPLFNKETVAPPTSPTGELSVDDITDFLNTDDTDEVLELEEPPKPKPVEDEEEEKPEPELESQDELSEIEEELEPPTEDELELVTPVRRKEILAKYPNLFKEFPYLERAYYREQRFTEMFPTMQDAEGAVEARKTLDNFEQDVMQGNLTTLLKTVKQHSPEGFNRMADNLMDMLKSADERAYYHVLSSVSKATIVAMVHEGRKANNEPLQQAAQILNQFLFGSSEFQPVTRLSKDEPTDRTREEELNQRQQAFLQEQFDTVRTDLDTKVENTLTNTIATHIDPKKAMTDYIRSKATDDALALLRSQIEGDRRFQALNDKLWEKAFQSRFKREDVLRIKSAYLARAKSLLPAVIKKARADALRGMGRKVTEEPTTHKGPVSQGRPRSQEPSGKVTKPQDIPKGMSTLEFLNSD